MRGWHVFAGDGLKIEDIDRVLRAFDQLTALRCPNHRVRQLRWNFCSEALDRARGNERACCEVLKKSATTGADNWRCHMSPQQVIRLILGSVPEIRKGFSDLSSVRLPDTSLASNQCHTFGGKADWTSTDFLLPAKLGGENFSESRSTRVTDFK